MDLTLLEGAGLKDWILAARRINGKWVIEQNKAYTAEREPRPPEHNHENELPARVVLSFDLHRTLTPDYGFPLLSPPFPGVKSFLDRMVSRGACIHVMTASMDRADVQILDARRAMILNWAANFGLPIGYVGPNVEANVRLDDRGVTIDSVETETGPNWVRLSAQAEKRLLDTWILDPETDLYLKREDLTPVGDVVGPYPEITDTPDDAPRGWSTPLLDIDIHRTINPGWGSTREAAPLPAAIRAIQEFYTEGYQIQLSCAGWMRSTHTQAQSDQRLAAFRLYFRKYGIPFDRIVTKDDCDLWFDDKTVQFNSWRQATPLVLERLEAAKKEHPAYDTGQTLDSTYQRSESASAEIAKLEIQIKSLNERFEKDRPVNVVVNLPEGMVSHTTNVAPPNLTIAAGAVQVPITNTPSAGDLEIQHPDGRRTTLRRSR